MDGRRLHLVLAGFLVLAGSTADRVGRRKVFQIGLATFGIGSLLYGLAPNVGWLVAARRVQAVGGTMLNPVAMAIVTTTFPGPTEQARAIGAFGRGSASASWPWDCSPPDAGPWEPRTGRPRCSRT
ncbi:MFS transporter [Streptosporangium saharense]|uniref:MFS transporter n=1 Tax=Streptosporangium saharense TaxID=1706840 RepID=UPI0033165D71